jgi:cytidylate kinase
LGTSSEIVESMENRSPGFGERVLAKLSAALPEVNGPAPAPSADLVLAYRREIEGLVRQAAAGGDAVILGRFGNAILAGRRDLLRVFIHAPLAWRIAKVSAALDCPHSGARTEIARVDEASRTYAREHYRMAWGELHNYDLTVDTSRYGIEGAADVIAAAVRSADQSA